MPQDGFKTMKPTKRQLLAQSLCDTLQRRGAWVTSPMPLSPDSALRVDCLSSDAAMLTDLLEAMGLDVRFCGVQQQMRPAAIVEQYSEGSAIKTRRKNGPAACATYEVILPSDSDDGDRQPSGELRKRDSAEVSQMLRALGRR
jgi:hypothetical protein